MSRRLTPSEQLAYDCLTYRMTATALRIVMGRRASKAIPVSTAGSSLANLIRQGLVNCEWRTRPDKKAKRKIYWRAAQ